MRFHLWGTVLAEGPPFLGFYRFYLVSRRQPPRQLFAFLWIYSLSLVVTANKLFSCLGLIFCLEEDLCLFGVASRLPKVITAISRFSRLGHILVFGRIFEFWSWPAGLPKCSQQLVDFHVWSIFWVSVGYFWFLEVASRAPKVVTAICRFSSLEHILAFGRIFGFWGPPLLGTLWSLRSK